MNKYEDPILSFVQSLLETYTKRPVIIFLDNGKRICTNINLVKVSIHLNNIMAGFDIQIRLYTKYNIISFAICYSQEVFENLSDSYMTIFRDITYKLDKFIQPLPDTEMTNILYGDTGGSVCPSFNEET